MKNKFFMIMFMVANLTFLVNCAKSSDNNSNAAVGVAGTCTTAGYVYTSQGCLPTGYAQCQAGYGYSPTYGCLPPSYTTGTTCTTAGYVSTTQYGCVPGNTAYSCGTGMVYATQYGCVAGTSSTGIYGGTCQAGYVGTVMGCLPQNGCPTGYGYYYGVYNGQTGGWCYPRTY